MGILDEAIRDHLELKRRGGAAEGDLRRLEDEAFGPPSRPDEPASNGGAHDEVREASATAVEEPPPERGEAEAPPEQAGPGPQGESMFHDFAAEEGLVSVQDAAPPTPPVEKESEFDASALEVDEQEAPTETSLPEAPQPEPPTPAPPGGTQPLDDTQPHDMASELELDEDLDLHLDEEESDASTGVEETKPASGDPPSDQGAPAEVVEEEDVEIVEEVEVDEQSGGDESAEESDDSEEDVLEETPDFLRETPEHDRLWFEQKPPKDFDFDE